MSASRKPALRIGDPEYLAATAWSMGVILSTQGHPEAAGKLARDAIADLNRLDEPTDKQLAVLGPLHLLLAVQEARLRNEHASLNALDTAERAALVTGENNAHRLVFGPTNVSMHRAAVSFDLSRASEARRATERLDVSHLPSRRRVRETPTLRPELRPLAERVGVV